MKKGLLIKTLSGIVASALIAGNMSGAALAAGLNIYNGADVNNTGISSGNYMDAGNISGSEIGSETGVSAGAVSSYGNRGVVTVALDLAEHTIQFGGFPEADEQDDPLSAAGDALSPDSLTQDEVYDLIDSAIASGKDSVNIKGSRLTASEVTDIVSDILNDNATYFTVTGANAVLDGDGNAEAVDILYAENAADEKAEYEAVVAAILCRINPEWDDEQRIFFLHDYLVTHCQYDLTYSSNPNNIPDISYTAYGALVLHVAVCQGYSLAFSDLANRAGVPTDLVTSRANNHAWNLVSLHEEDYEGDHYYVDCTWDDPVYNDDKNGDKTVHLQQYYCGHENLLLSETGMIATGHKPGEGPGDWTVSDGIVNNAYMDTTYDEADWKNCFSPFVCYADVMFFVYRLNSWYETPESKRGLFMYNFYEKTSDLVMSIPFETVPVEGQPNAYTYWYNPCITLVGDRIFFNNSKEIYSVDPGSLEPLDLEEYDPENEPEQTLVYTLTTDEQEKGSICGMNMVGTASKKSGDNYMDTLGRFIQYDIGTSDYSDLQKTGDGELDTIDKVESYLELDKNSISFEKPGDQPVSLSAVVRIPEDEDLCWFVWPDDGSVVEMIEEDDESVTVTPVGTGMAVISAAYDFSWVCCRVSVDTDWQNDYYYTIVDGGLQITGYSGNETDITIPAKAVINGVLYPVFSVSLSGNNNITSVTLEDGMAIRNELDFSNCTSLESIDFGTVNVTRLKMLDLSHCSALEEIDLDWYGNDNYPYNLQYLSFQGCSGLKIIDLSCFGTGSLKDMSGLFSGCTSLEKVSLGGCDLSNVKNMSTMFEGCGKLADVDFDYSYWAIPGSVENMSCMFKGCKSLESLDMSQWATENVTNMSSMFYGCEKLRHLEMDGGWSTESATDLSGMFYGCKSLGELDLAAWETGNVTNISNMFYGCSSLDSIDMSGWDTGNVTNINSLFYGCVSLEEIDLSMFDLSSLTDSTKCGHVFYDCASLKTLYTPFNLNQTVTICGENEGRNRDPFIDKNEGDKECTELPKGLNEDEEHELVRTIYVLSLDIYEKKGTDLVKAAPGTTFEMNKGETKDLTAVIFPINSDDDTVKWESADSSAVFINAGRIRVHEFRDKPVKITVTAQGGKTPIVNEYFVEVNSSNISLSPKEITFTGINDSEKITATVTGGGDVTWKSSDLNVATVSADGTVVAVGLGAAIITANANGEEASCRVYVDTSWQKDYDFEFDEDGCLCLTAYNGNEESLDIPSTATIRGVTYPVSSLSLTNDTSIKQITLDTTGSLSNKCMLQNCTALETVMLNAGDGSKAKGLSFRGCRSLKTFGRNNVDVSEITDMSFMFSGCSSLKSLKLDDWDIGAASDLSNMFDGCSSLESLEITGWKTGKVSRMNNMFKGCSSLKSLDLSSFDLSGITSASDCADVFKGCTALGSIGTPVKLSREIFLPYAFSDSEGNELKCLPMNSNVSLSLHKRVYVNSISLFEETEHGTAYYSSYDIIEMEKGDQRTLKAKLTPENADDLKVTWESEFPDAVSVDKNGILTALKNNAQKVLITATASGGVTPLKEYIYVQLRTSRVISLSETEITFEGIRGNKTLTATIVGGGEAVWKCSDEKVATVSDKGVVTPAGYGRAVITASFEGEEATCIVNIDTEWQKDYKYVRSDNDLMITGYTGSAGTVTIPAAAVIGGETCTVSSVIINDNPVLTSVSFEKGTAVSSLNFKDCKALVKADLSNLDTSKVVSAKNTFWGCAALESLDMSGCDLSAVTDSSDMLYGCTSLKEIKTWTGLTEDVALPDVFVDQSEIQYHYVPGGLGTSISLILYEASALTCETPVAKPGSGTYTEKVDVTLTSATDGATILYTLDGSVPDGNSEKYVSPFTIKKTCTLKAIAVKEDYNESAVAEFRYEIKGSGGDTNGIRIEGLEESYQYTGAKVTPSFRLVDYDVENEDGQKGRNLVKGVDYTVKYSNNKNVGNSAGLTVTGKGNYTGLTLSKTFAIVTVQTFGEEDLIDLKGAKMAAIAPLAYTGEAQYPNVTVILKGGAPVNLIYDESTGAYADNDGNEFHANASFSNNVDKGTATLLLTGKKNEKGKETTLKKTFKINPADLTSGGDKVSVEAEDTFYAVRGAAPESLSVKYDGEELIPGEDFTVKYGSNKKASENVQVTITGKGNYKGRTFGTYKIAKLNLEDCIVNALSVKAGVKAGKLKALILDGKGNPLGAKQYQLKIRKDDNDLPADYVLRAGDEIYVTAVCANGEQNIVAGSETGEECFSVGTDFSKAKGSLTGRKTYTGSPVTLEEGDISVTIKGNASPLRLGQDYEITGYSQNVDKGNATAYLKGIGLYSGYSTMKFRIDGKSGSAK